jgi:hypothetical protein
MSGVDGFVAGLRDCGVTTVIQDGVVVFSVEPVDGVMVGQIVSAGVSTNELTAWPAVPPHWVHLPNAVRFARSNPQPSELPGWTKHSRGTNGWGDAAHPAQAYLAHVRAVVGEAA